MEHKPHLESMESFLPPESTEDIEQGQEQDQEKGKSSLLSKARWAVLGASLLLTGCSDFMFGKKEGHEQKEKTEVLKSFDFEGSFPVDKAELSDKSKVKIERDIKEFIDQYNSKDKFSELKSSRIVIKVSSDERPTNNWEDGNEGLSKARLQELDRTLRKVIQDYQFSADIKPEAASSFKRKTFTKKTPAGAWGSGFTPITEFSNPLTGKNFTEKEAKALSNKNKEEFYSKARYAKIDFELPGKDEREKQFEQLVDIMDSYNNITLMLDASGSMNDDYAILAEKFRNAYGANKSEFENDTTYIVPFVEAPNLKQYKEVPAIEVADYIEDTRGFGSVEKVFASLEQLVNKKLESVRSTERKAVVTITDEGIQDFSIAKLNDLRQLGSQDNLDMYFALIAENDLITFVDKEGLVYEFNQFVEDKIKDNKYFPDSMNVEARKQWVMDNVKEVQLDDDGNLDFKIPRNVRPS